MATSLIFYGTWQGMSYKACGTYHPGTTDVDNYAEFDIESVTLNGVDAEIVLDGLFVKRYDKLSSALDAFYDVVSERATEFYNEGAD